MFSLPFNVYMNRIIKEVKKELGRKRTRSSEEGKVLILLGLLYTDDLLICGESADDLRVMAERFEFVWQRKHVKAKANTNTEMVLRREKELLCEVSVN